MAEGLIIAAPASGSGKTLVTLAMLRALKRAGVAVASAKVGPDYIDPRFHEAATGRPCVNLDGWAMRSSLVKSLAAEQARDTELVIIEGVMGLFDGADTGKGSTADLAASTGLPVVLVVDASRQSQSVAALVHGFRSFRSDINVAAVILNRVGSPRHAQVLRASIADVPVIGAIPRLAHLDIPSRHLGLVQAGEIERLEDFLERAADDVHAHLDFSLLPSAPVMRFAHVSPLPPLGQTIAIANDAAFGFTYPHLLGHWHAAGAELRFFSPLADEPVPHADAVFLPGGYPELHGQTIAAASRFLESLRTAAQRSLIYGECGGYMVLSEGLIDAEGTRHAMAGLLPVTTSFRQKKMHLGYRRLTHQSPLPWPARLRGHEFHFASETDAGRADPLFAAQDSLGQPLAPMGLQRGKVLGSWAHVIDAELD